MAGVEDMIHAAEATLGLGETNGNNTNYITRWYGLNAAWCDMSVSYWAAHSGNAAAVGRFAYTVAHAEWFRQRGQWHVDIAGIRRGDIVFFDWEGSNSIGNIDHVGIVTSVSGGNVYTIEGNISNQCLRKVRGSGTIAGYGRPAYVGAPKPPAPKPVPQYASYPGAGFFVNGRKSPIIEKMHNRLVAEKCNKYTSNSNKDTWGSGDKASYRAWQLKLGYKGSDADGIPGANSWNRLKVPK